MKALSFRSFPLPSSKRIGAHSFPTIWRSKLAYDTGAHGFGHTPESGSRHAR